MICDSPTGYYFSKTYPVYPGSPFTEPLTVQYSKCTCCGFVLSETHRAMPRELWASLNISWHHHYENPATPKLTNQPPYANQGLTLAMLDRNGIVDLDDTLDYAAGYATLVQFLDKYFRKEIKAFDRYVRNPAPGIRYVDEEALGRYSLVINSAMFEHVLDRAALDEVDRLVADDGVLMLHGDLRAHSSGPRLVLPDADGAHCLPHQSQHDDPDGTMELCGVDLLPASQELVPVQERFRAARPAGGGGRCAQPRDPDRLPDLQAGLRRLLEGLLSRAPSRRGTAPPGYS